MGKLDRAGYRDRSQIHVMDPGWAAPPPLLQGDSVWIGIRRRLWRSFQSGSGNDAGPLGHRQFHHAFDARQGDRQASASNAQAQGRPVPPAMGRDLPLPLTALFSP